ncbi:hypothetical protein HUJ05_012225 [Dendroctonus ponderosae]|nr:hypothetical protein HUJ05_012225 [Dendroctonus ponderosae]
MSFRPSSPAHHTQTDLRVQQTQHRTTQDRNLQVGTLVAICVSENKIESNSARKETRVVFNESWCKLRTGGTQPTYWDLRGPFPEAGQFGQVSTSLHETWSLEPDSVSKAVELTGKNTIEEVKTGEIHLADRSKKGRFDTVSRSLG